MDELYQEIFSRNIGIFTELEQDKIRKAAVTIAGMGGVSSLLAERLIRLGIGRLKITDSSANRAETVMPHIQDINPQARVVHFDTAITCENDARLFVADCDLVIDDMGSGLWRRSVLLQRAARQGEIHYILTLAIGFGALVVVFSPRAITMEEYGELSPDIDSGGIEKMVARQGKISPAVPAYAAMVAAIIKEVMAGESPPPTNSIGMGVASLLAANEAINVILNKRDMVEAPEYKYVDLLERNFIVGTLS